MFEKQHQKLGKQHQNWRLSAVIGEICRWLQDIEWQS
jgi:hypothetical protein